MYSFVQDLITLVDSYPNLIKRIDISEEAAEKSFIFDRRAPSFFGLHTPKVGEELELRTATGTVKIIIVRGGN